METGTVGKSVKKRKGNEHNWRVTGGQERLLLRWKEYSLCVY